MAALSWLLPLRLVDPSGFLLLLTACMKHSVSQWFSVTSCECVREENASPFWTKAETNSTLHSVKQELFGGSDPAS